MLSSVVSDILENKILKFNNIFFLLLSTIYTAHKMLKKSFFCFQLTIFCMIKVEVLFEDEITKQKHTVYFIVLFFCAKRFSNSTSLLVYCPYI